jgi:hypothetical protein
MPLTVQDPGLLQRIMSLPESGMGYQIVTVRLKDGRNFERVIIVEGRLTDHAGLWTPPFSQEDIADIAVTHDRSGPPMEAK